MPECPLFVPMPCGCILAVPETMPDELFNSIPTDWAGRVMACPWCNATYGPEINEWLSVYVADVFISPQPTDIVCLDNKIYKVDEICLCGCGTKFVSRGREQLKTKVAILKN